MGHPSWTSVAPRLVYHAHTLDIPCFLQLEGQLEKTRHTLPWSWPFGKCPFPLCILLCCDSSLISPLSGIPQAAMYPPLLLLHRLRCFCFHHRFTAVCAHL